MSGLRTSWQTLLADLALVLFIITAAALGRAKLEHRAAPTAPPASSEIAAPASPLAVYGEGPGAPALGAWIRQQAPDTREQLTIVTHYRPDGEAALPGRIAALLAAARGAGTHPRIVIEPGPGGTSAGIGFDAPMPPATPAAPSSPSHAQDRTTP